MTGQQLFDLAVGRMGISPSNATSYADTIIPQINTILAKTFTLENNVRAYKSLTLLTVIPEIALLSETLTYQDDVLKNVVANGLSKQLAVSDGEFALANYFTSEYEEGKNMVKKMVSTEIVDFASGEE